MEADYPEIYHLAKPYLATRDNEVHTRVAYSFALKLLEVEQGNRAVVLPAVILHDVGWKMVPEEDHLKAFGPGRIDPAINRIHEVEGSRKAREILERVGYDPVLTDEICEIILGHDSRKAPLSMNDTLVKESDRLWRYSEEALRIDPARFRVDHALHAHWLGRQIDRWFYTATAKKLAREEQRKRVAYYGPPPPHK